MHQDEHICIHHVGGRAGSRGFPVVKAFERDLVSVLYDADSECLEQVKARNRHLGSRLFVLPYCLAEAPQEVNLHVNYDPYTSSILSRNPDYDAYYYVNSWPQPAHDYVLGDTMRTMREIPLRAHNLDEVLGKLEKDVPAPDFLSLDTEGSEYRILEGARETIRSRVLGLKVEVEFHPLYHGQKLFGDVCGLLSDWGFHFVGVLNLQELAPYRYPVGLRGQGFQTNGDALFLRRLENLPDADVEFQVRALRKLAFMSILFGQVEYGLECLKRAGERRPTAIRGEGGSPPAYLQFLNEFQQAAGQVPGLFPPTFSEVFSFEESRARFRVAEDEDFQNHTSESTPDLPVNRQNSARDTESLPGFRRRLKAFLGRIPGALSAALRIKRAWQALMTNPMVDSRHEEKCDTSPVEAILLRYGLGDTARMVQQRRTRHENLVPSRKTGER